MLCLSWFLFTISQTDFDVSFSFTIALTVIIININNTVTDKNRLI